MSECKPLDDGGGGGGVTVASAAGVRLSSAGGSGTGAGIVLDAGKTEAGARRQGLTLVPISAQLELPCPPYDPN